MSAQVYMDQLYQSSPIQGSGDSAEESGQRL